MDDFSPAPIAPSIDLTEPVDDQELITEDVKLADSFFHPAWEQVQKIFDEQIEACRFGTNNSALAADEYKIEDQVNKRVAARLAEVLVRVQNAVESVESIKRKRTTGGK